MTTIRRKNALSGWTTFMGVLIVTLFTACQTNSNAQESEPPEMTIHEAVFMGNEAEIQKHIKAGSDLTEKDAYGSTPLHVAATFGKTKAAELLINAGADLSVTSADGSTPLHTAAFFCRPEIAEMLLENGVDIKVRNNYGSTALESISAPFESVKPIYDQISRDLGPMGLHLDYDYIKKTRPVIATMIREKS